MDRRNFLLRSTGAVAAAALSETPAWAYSSATPEGAKLNSVFDRIVTEELDRSPMEVSDLGFDKGARARQKSQLDDRSIAAWESDKQRTADQLARLRRIDRRALSTSEQVNYDAVMFGLDLTDQVNRGFAYIGASDYNSPYVLSQLTGAYQEVPEFLSGAHGLETTDDADAYLARLSAFPTMLDQETERARHDAAAGVTPPDFVIDKALVQMRLLRDAPPDKSDLVQSLARRTHEKGIVGPWEAKAAVLFSGPIRAALDRQIAQMTAMRARAGHAAGVARLPDGDAFYALALKQETSSDRSPAEIHQAGLEMVKSLNAQIDTALRAQGYTHGTVHARLRALYDDPKLRYPNTEEAKAQLIENLNAKVAEVQAKLPQWFGTLPKSRLTIRRVPKATEAGTSAGHYNIGSLDGLRPGIYYINLRDTAETPRWILPTLTYHEGVPGHHVQLSLALEADVPLVRQLSECRGYGEGWALYAEELAVEMGMYERDPLGHVGQLHDAMMRAVRLVLDTGLHTRGWDREQAIRYGIETLGSPEATVTSEVERYCVWPGQACTYMLGKMEWVRLRKKAEDALGARFDIRRFHDAGLLSGSIPLAVLERRVEAYVQSG